VFTVSEVDSVRFMIGNRNKQRKRKRVAKAKGYVFIDMPNALGLTFASYQQKPKGEITCSVCGGTGHSSKFTRLRSIPLALTPLTTLEAQREVCPGRPTAFSKPNMMDQPLPTPGLSAGLASGLVTPGTTGPLTDNSSAGGSGFKLKFNLPTNRGT
jgi:hypothetical protein